MTEMKRRWIRMVWVCSALSALSSVSAREFTDDIGRRVTIPDRPSRIVSISPSFTEILYAIGAGPWVIGGTDYCTYPSAALTLQRVGGSMTPNVERIIAMKPDLVVGEMSTYLSRERLEQMERAGVAVVMFSTRSVEEILDRMGKLGTLCGTEREAAAAVRGLRGRLRAVETRVKGLARPKILCVVWAEPLWTIGRPTFLHDAIVLAGGANVAGDLDQPHTTFSFEEVVKRDPDQVILAFHDASAEKMPPSWKVLRAVQAGRCVVVNPDHVIYGGPRLIDGIEEMAELFHPQAGKSQAKKGNKVKKVSKVSKETQ